MEMVSINNKGLNTEWLRKGAAAVCGIVTWLQNAPWYCCETVREVFHEEWYSLIIIHCFIFYGTL
jgi:hypothetical protein